VHNGSSGFRGRFGLHFFRRRFDAKRLPFELGVGDFFVLGGLDGFVLRSVGRRVSRLFEFLEEAEHGF